MSKKTLCTILSLCFLVYKNESMNDHKIPSPRLSFPSRTSFSSSHSWCVFSHSANPSIHHLFLLQWNINPSKRPLTQSTKHEQQHSSSRHKFYARLLWRERQWWLYIFSHLLQSVSGNDGCSISTSSSSLLDSFHHLYNHPPK